MSDTVTHITGSLCCGQARTGDSESARPEAVSCARCRWNIGERVTERLGGRMVPWFARRWGWLGSAA